MANTGYEFGDDVEYIESAPEEGRVQWFHHKKSCDPTGKKVLGDICGWCIQAGRWDYLDRVCEKAGLKQHHVKQGANINIYWQLGSASQNQSEWGSARFFVLAKGMLSESEMGMTGGRKGFNGKREGVAAGWRKDKDKDKPQKSLKFRAFPEELLAQGLERPVIVSVSGQSRVDDLLVALGKDGHGRVIRANNVRLEAKGARPVTPLAGFSLALMVGDQQDCEQGSTVTKIVTDIPATIDDTFLDDHHVSGWWPLIWEDIKTNGYSIEWSKEASSSIYNGDTEEAEPVSEPSSNAEAYEDHPFDDGMEYDEEFAARAAEAPKPAAKPKPSNATSKPSDADLQGIPGTALLPQRKILRDKLGRNDLALKAGLTREDAVKHIVELQKAQR